MACSRQANPGRLPKAGWRINIMPSPSRLDSHFFRKTQQPDQVERIISIFLLISGKSSFMAKNWAEFILLAVFLFSCQINSSRQTSSVQEDKSQASLDQLAEWMTGYFNSSDQAEEDSSYYDISLYMVRIWPERDDGYWLYIEQAVSEMGDRPYRQRVYQLTREEDDYLSRVFELPDPGRFVNQYADPRSFIAITPDSLMERKGCEVSLTPSEGAYRGGTAEKTCESSLRGASYATSRVSVYEDHLESWDQGFDAEGSQVWGAEKGGYIFMKKKNYGI